eukprot:38523-Amorphochlora_amoeboformis.AAC.1
MTVNSALAGTQKHPKRPWLRNGHSKSRLKNRKVFIGAIAVQLGRQAEAERQEIASMDTQREIQLIAHITEPPESVLTFPWPFFCCSRQCHARFHAGWAHGPPRRLLIGAGEHAICAVMRGGVSEAVEGNWMSGRPNLVTSSKVTRDNGVRSKLKYSDVKKGDTTVITTALEGEDISLGASNVPVAAAAPSTSSILRDSSWKIVERSLTRMSN